MWRLKKKKQQLYLFGRESLLYLWCFPPLLFPGLTVFCSVSLAAVSCSLTLSHPQWFGSKSVWWMSLGELEITVNTWSPPHSLSTMYRPSHILFLLQRTMQLTLIPIHLSTRWDCRSLSERPWNLSEVAQSRPTLCDPMNWDPPSTGFSKHEYWSGLPFPSPGDLPNPGIELGSPAL